MPAAFHGQTQNGTAGLAAAVAADLAVAHAVAEQGKPAPDPPPCGKKFAVFLAAAGEISRIVAEQCQRRANKRQPPQHPHAEQVARKIQHKERPKQDIEQRVCTVPPVHEAVETVEQLP